MTKITQPTQPPQPPARARDYRDLCLEHYAELHADADVIRERLIAELVDATNDRDIAVGLARDAIKETLKARRHAAEARRDAAREREQRVALADEFQRFRARMIGASQVPGSEITPRRYRPPSLVAATSEPPRPHA